VGPSSGWPLGAHALDRSVTIVKAAFGHACEMELIDRPLRSGKALARSSAAEKRRARNTNASQNGRKPFQPEGVRARLAGSEGNTGRRGVSRGGWSRHSGASDGDTGGGFSAWCDRTAPARSSSRQLCPSERQRNVRDERVAHW
jgi:hypothetical protein